MKRCLSHRPSIWSIAVCLLPLIAARVEAQDPTDPPSAELWSDDPVEDDDEFVELFDTGANFGTPYRWVVRADGIFLHRSPVDGEQSLAFGNPATPKATEVINTADLDFASSWGPRVSIARCFGINSIEVSYFQIDNWNSMATRSGAISVQFPSFAHPPLPPGPFGTVNFNYSSKLYNGEANIRHTSANGWLDWIIGFRYVEFSDDFGAVFATGGGTSRYNIGTQNNLAGFQVGGEAHIWERGNWSVDGWVKAGVFNNSVGTNTFEDVSALGGGTATVGASRDQTAFLGEIGLAAVLRVTERLGVRAGYQVFWMDRVALAPEQLDNVNPAIPLATADLAGDLILHGGFVGFEGIY